jgi:phosphoglucan,water dikinase
VAEFQLFAAELRDFFNAKSAMERLDQVEAALDGPSLAALARLRASKAALESQGTPAALQAWAAAHGGGSGTAERARECELLLDTLHSATSVRAALAASLASGLRNDAPDSALISRQAFRGAEQGLEEWAFVLASRCVACVEAQSASPAWGPGCTAALLSLRQLGLSGFRPAECLAAERGLEAARDDPGVGSDADSTRRLLSALQRCRRLAEAHASALLALFSERAMVLGGALGVDSATHTVFGEAAVRASTSFPLSQLCQHLSRCCASSMGGDGSECLVGGDAVGTLVRLLRIAPGCLDGVGGEEPFVLLLDSADGDEELSTLGRPVVAVLLLQQLPHLSHLAVRCRQEAVLLATCPPDAAPAQRAASLQGRRVRLRAASEGAKLQLEQSSSAPSAVSQPQHHRAQTQAGPTRRASEPLAIPLSDAAADSCGAKAAVCAQLLAMATASSGDAAFLAPAGCVLPFGVMEAVLSSTGQGERYATLLDALETAQPGAELDSAVAQMRMLLSAAALPQALAAAIRSHLGGAAACVVRSSANVEDLAGLSAAGLYESVAGVAASDDSALGAAVAAVWASLHTRRAVLARRAAGLPQKEAAMAVLIQEQVSSELSFVLHTQAPGGAQGELLAEIAVGMGETLASGANGSAWRLVATPAESGATVRTAAFANFSEALMPSDGGLRSVAVDYSGQALSCSKEARTEVGRRLAAVGWGLQAALGGAPQDVEGAVAGGKLFVVQSRPQPL